MPISLDEIPANTQIEYQDNVHVTGNIGQGAVINMQRGKTLTIDGDVADNVKMKSYDVIVHVKGKIGKNCIVDTYNGKITVNGHVHEGSLLKSYNADIVCHHAGSHSVIETFNGNITVDKLGHDAKVNSHNGNIIVKAAHESAKINSNKGDVSINGVKLPKKAPEPVNYGRVSIFKYGNTTEVVYHDPIVCDNFTI